MNYFDPISLLIHDGKVVTDSKLIDKKYIVPIIRMRKISLLQNVINQSMESIENLVEIVTLILKCRRADLLNELKIENAYEVFSQVDWDCLMDCAVIHKDRKLWDMIQKHLRKPLEEEYLKKCDSVAFRMILMEWVLAQKRILPSVWNRYILEYWRFCLDCDDSEKLKSLLHQRDCYNRTVLHLACSEGRVDSVKRLLALGFDINAVDDENETPLYCVLSTKHAYELLKLLLFKGAEMIVPKNKVTHLMFCSYHGNSRCIFFINKNINTVTEDKQSALFFAVYGNHADIVDKLLKNGAKKDLVDVDGNTPLTLALLLGHESSALVLIQNNADLNVKIPKEGFTTLLYCWQILRSSSLCHAILIRTSVTLLINTFFPDHSPEEDHYIFVDNFRAILEYFLGYQGLKLSRFGTVKNPQSIPIPKSTGWVNESNDYDHSLLSIVERMDELFYMLSAKNIGGLLYLLNRNGWTPSILSDSSFFRFQNMEDDFFLHQACIECSHIAVKLCLELGANVNMPMNDLPPLFLGIQRLDDNRILESLVQHSGVDINIRDGRGNNSLHVAVDLENSFALDELLKCKIEFIQNDFGENPLMIACEKGLLTFVEKLIQSYGDNIIHQTCCENHSSLHYAVFNNQMTVVTLLLEKGSKVTSEMLFLSSFVQMNNDIFSLLLQFTSAQVLEEILDFDFRSFGFALGMKSSFETIFDQRDFDQRDDGCGEIINKSPDEDCELLTGWMRFEVSRSPLHPVSERIFHTLSTLKNDWKVFLVHEFYRLYNIQQNQDLIWTLSKDQSSLILYEKLLELITTHCPMLNIFDTLNYVGEKQETFLDFAVKDFNFEAFSLLLHLGFDQGPYTHQRIQSLKTSLIANNAQCFKSLMMDHFTPFDHHMVKHINRNTDEEIIDHIMDNNPRLEYDDYYHIAVNGNEKFCLFVLNRLRDDDLLFLIDNLILHGHLSLLKKISSKLQSVRVDDRNSWLTLSVLSKSKELVRYLLKHKIVDANQSELFCNLLPIQVAAAFGYIEIVKLLLEWNTLHPHQDSRANEIISSKYLVSSQKMRRKLIEIGISPSLIILPESIGQE